MFLIFLLILMTQINGQTLPAPPVAKTIPHRSTLHGDTRTDNYFWLRDRKAPDTIPYLEAENAYTQAVMAHTDALQAKLYSEMLGRIKQTDETVPVRRGDYYYYTRTEEGKQYAVYCRKHASPAAPEEVLLDGNHEAEGKKYFRVGDFVPSPDGKLLAYSTDVVGDESYTVHVKDLAAGKLLADTIKGIYYSLEWSNDNASFFYTILDAAHRPFKVFRHDLGKRSDTLVYHEPDERFTVEVSKTSSKAYLLIQIQSSVTSEVRYISAGHAKNSFQVLLPRLQGVEYEVTHHGDSFFIRTNDHARGFRVVQAPVKDPSRPQWKEIIPGRDGVTVEEVHAFSSFLAIEERDHGLTKLRVQDYSSEKHHYVDFAEPAYTASLQGNTEFDTEMLRYTYSSLVTPPSVFDYNTATHNKDLKKQQEVLGGYDSSQYSVERIFAKAEDGVEVPISLVYRKGMVRDGKAPMLLYGYGSYGISIDPSFRSDRLSLLDRGVVFAIAHIRGGGDMGKPWHEAGRLLTKKNTFTDFIASADHLIREKYTSADRLAIVGRSAGGLLMGAVVNMRPDLFAVVIAGVPFVDVLNTMPDASLPFTVGEYEEWGNPNEKQFYDYIRSYAPYENVPERATGPWPKMLITAGLNDPRVSYWEPAKWTAKLRLLNASPRLLLKTEMGSGHFGSSGRYEYLKETAFNFAFLLDSLGIEQ